MSSASLRSKLVLVAVLGLFGYGLLNLLDRRFDAGDVYPAGSSLRADPLGTKVLFSALERLELEVSRNLDAEPAVPAEPHEVVLILPALDSCDLLQGSRILGAADSFARRGARVLLLLDHEQLSCAPGLTSARLFGPRGQGGPSLLGHWGLALEAAELAGASTAIRDADAAQSVPAEVVVPGRLSLAALSPDWQVVLRRQQRPVAAVRRLGQGSLAIVTSSFPLSNEAMQSARSTELLLWLLGGARRVVFDEAHLGVSEERGVVQLLGKLHLYGFVFGLLALFGLFAWRRLATFCPRPVREQTLAPPAGVPGELVALLMRALPDDELVKACVRERLSALGQRERTRLCLPALASANHHTGARDVPEHYNALVRLFSERRRS